MDNEQEFSRDKRAHVHYERKVNDGDYGSATVGGSVSFNVADGEDSRELQEWEFQQLREMAKKQYLEWKRAEREWESMVEADRYVKILEERLEQAVQYIKDMNQFVAEEDHNDWAEITGEAGPASWEWWK